jgi:hypothetical protein
MEKFLRNLVLGFFLFIFSLSFSLVMPVTLKASDTIASTVNNYKTEMAEKITVALTLAEFGRKEESPVLLGAAAELLAEVNIKMEKWDKSTKSGNIFSENTENEDELLAEYLFEEAIYLASDQNNEGLAHILTQLKNTATGQRHGADFAIGVNETVLSGDIDTFYHVFNGGEVAFVSIHTFEDNDIDLVIRDQIGNIVKEDLGPLSIGNCVWTPETTSAYNIEIINRSEKEVNYYLYSN